MDSKPKRERPLALLTRFSDEAFLDRVHSHAKKLNMSVQGYGLSLYKLGDLFSGDLGFKASAAFAQGHYKLATACWLRVQLEKDGAKADLVERLDEVILFLERQVDALAKKSGKGAS